MKTVDRVWFLSHCEWIYNNRHRLKNKPCANFVLTGFVINSFGCPYYGYLLEIKYMCLVMSKKYISKHFDDMKRYASIIEQRIDDSDFTQENAIKDNEEILQQCQKFGLPYHLIDNEYNLNVDL